MENMFSFSMTREFLSLLNIWAVLVSALAFFGLGSVWYSGLFGKPWSNELEKHGIKPSVPGPAAIRMKMGLTLLLNFLISFGMAFVNYHGGVVSWAGGLKMGIAISLFIALPVLGIAYNWEGKSLKLFLIDAGYAASGIVISAVICGAWR